MLPIVQTQHEACYRRHRTFLGACLLLLILASCSLQPSSNTGGKISLTLWYWNGSIDDNVIKAVSQHFPNIALNAQKISDYDTKVRTSMAAHRDVPDIMGINSNISTYFPDEDQFVDLRQLGADQVKSQYLDWKWNLGIAPDGKQIGFPMDTGPTALFYRPDIFAKAGLPTDPQAVAAHLKTWDDYLQAAVQLKAATHDKAYMIDNTTTVFTQMMAQSPTLFFDRAEHYLGDQPHVRQVWNKAVKASTLGLTAKVQSMTQAWDQALSNGLIASFVGAVWEKGTLQQSAPGTAGKWRVAPAPGGAGNNGGSFLAITTACQHPQEAFAVIQWIQSPANQLAAYKDVQLFPSAISDLNNPGMHQPEAFFGREDTTTVFAQSAKQVPLSFYGPENDVVGGAFSDQLSLIEFQKKNPEQAWNDAQQEAQRVVTLTLSYREGKKGRKERSMSSVTEAVAIPKSAVERKTVRRKSKLRQYLPLYLSIAPYFVVFLVFGIVPIIFSIYLAFNRWDGIGQMQFVGFSNFSLALTDPVFGKAVLNTFLIWIMSTVPMLFIALILAFFLFRITLPLLRPVILFTVISSTIGGLSLFAEPQVLFGNNGGIGNEGLTMSLYQYWQAFASYHFGYGAAVSWIIFFIILAFTLLNWKIIQRGQN